MAAGVNGEQWVGGRGGMGGMGGRGRWSGGRPASPTARRPSRTTHHRPHATSHGNHPTTHHPTTTAFLITTIPHAHHPPLLSIAHMPPPPSPHVSPHRAQGLDHLGLELLTHH